MEIPWPENDCFPWLDVTGMKEPNCDTDIGDNKWYGCVEAGLSKTRQWIPNMMDKARREDYESGNDLIRWRCIYENSTWDYSGC